MRFASFFRSRTTPFSSGEAFCGAGLSRMFCSTGKNVADLSARPVKIASLKPVAVVAKTAVAEDGSAGRGRSAAAASRAHRRERPFKARSIPGAKQRASDGARLRFADVGRHPRTGSGGGAGAGGARRCADFAAAPDPHARCTALPRHDARSLQCAGAPARHGDSFWPAVHCL